MTARKTGDPDESVDLSLVATDRLIDELFSRFEAGLVVLERASMNKADDLMEFVHRWNGGFSRTIGMVEVFKNRALLANSMGHLIDHEDIEDEFGGD